MTLSVHQLASIIAGHYVCSTDLYPYEVDGDRLRIAISEMPPHDSIRLLFWMDEKPSLEATLIELVEAQRVSFRNLLKRSYSDAFGDVN